LIQKNQILDSEKSKLVQIEIDQLINNSIEKKAEDISLSIELALKAKKLSEEHFYTIGLANSLIQLGKSYQNLSNYGEAMKAALQAKELFIGLNDISGESVCLDILGGVYNFLGDYNKRLDCNLKCLALREKANDVPAQLSTTNNIGDTYMSMGDYKNALRYFKICLTFPNLTPRIKAIVYCNIGEVYFYLKEYDSVSENVEKGLLYGKESDYWQIIIAAYLMEAKMLIIQNKNEEALLPLGKAKKVAIDKGNKEDEYILYLAYADAYGHLNQYEKAYHYLNKYNNLKEELLKDNNAQKLKKIEFEFQFQSIKNEAEETKEKNKLLTRAFNQIEAQRNEIELKNLSITDSIHYAKRIQNAILPSSEKVKNLLTNSFVFYQPKDIVSGDFYWIDRVGDEVVFSVIDCTGHGVPGAFVSLIAFNALNKIILEKQITKPSQILTEIDQIMISSFSKSEDTIRDGMDMGICTWNTKTNELQFSGAYHSLFVNDGCGLTEVKGNRESIGYSLYENKSEFVNHSITAKPKMIVYLSSDGFPDQFGGEKGKKLKWKGFKELLTKISPSPIDAQLPLMRNFLIDWQGDLEQLDDVCVLGVKF
jgi:serine phosphatase RsbU (regulator of sigma subunit)